MLCDSEQYNYYTAVINSKGFFKADLDCGHEGIV